MSDQEESALRPVAILAEPLPAEGNPRRIDVEAKQQRVAALLHEVNCQGLLVLEPENFAWLTGGATVAGNLDPAAWPALFFTADERWLITTNVDTQRLFDEEIAGLGFQLKEWPWHWGRQQLLADILHGRRVACDQARNGCPHVGEQLRQLRRVLSSHDQACYWTLGQTVAHALEATGRALTAPVTECEVAGQLSHRLLHRGVQPVAITVAADDRLRSYRQCGFTAAPIRRHCVLMVTARSSGLYVMASRAVSLGSPDPAFRREFDAAARISAAYLASSWPDSVPRDLLATARRFYTHSGFEHEWLLSPQGQVTGWSPVELPLTPRTTEQIQAGMAVTWCVRVGAAASCDTLLIAADGPKLVTPSDAWPQQHIRVQGMTLIRPNLLQR